MAKKTDKTPLKKGTANFQLIGEAKIGDYTFKMDEQSSKSDWIYNVLNLGVDCGNGNVIYADMMGGYGAERDNVIYVHGIKEDESGRKQDDYENSFTIDWDDRFDDSVLETIGDNCFITVGLEKDAKGKVFTKRFLSQYDAIEYIKEHLENGTVVNVKGNIKYSQYNDTVQLKKEINSIFLSKADEVSKYKATFNQTILVDKDSVGKLDKEKASFPITGYVVDYVGKVDGKEIKTNVVFAKSFELEVDKEKPENTKKLIDKLFKVKKSGSLVEVTVEGELIEGQAIVDITYDDLPDDIKELVDIGVYSEEDALSKCAVGNNKEKRMIIRKPVIKKIKNGEEVTIKVLIDKDKYLETDLVFLSEFLDTEEEKEEVNDETSDVTDDSSDDEDSWLNALDDM